jgi:glycosyltransferase involved in cell wall biosynthesis
MNPVRFAFVIPVYRYVDKLKQVIAQAKPFQAPIFVVDDGCDETSCRVLDQISDVTILRHPHNLGKGAAILTGMKAVAKAVDWVVTLDADGQHDPGDTQRFLDAIQRMPRGILVGHRQGMSSQVAPWTSRFGRKFSNFWVRASGGPKLEDSQSGFRCYPLPECLALGCKSRRFQWEVEILVLARWKGLPVHEVPIHVSYQPKEKRVSQFRPWVDFWRNSATFSRLIFKRLLIPRRFRAQRTIDEPTT